MTAAARGEYGWYMQPSAAPTQLLPILSDLPADAVALHEAISQLVRVYQFRDRDRICCYDISVTQCYALELLAQHGSLRSQALADLLKLDKSTVTRVVDALVRKGYVERKRDAEDSRALALEVTASGRALYAKINRSLILQQAELLADLDPATRAAAAALIRRLAVAAEARFESGVSVDASCGTGECC